MENKIDRLTQISREKSLFFEEFFDWQSYNFNKEMIGLEWFMDEELISIFWTKEYEELSETDKKKLSYYEACQIIYIYGSSEWVFCLFLARILLNYKIWSSEYNFILREQIEEYRHQDMFERVLKLMQSEHSEMSKIWKWTMRWEATYVFPKYFYILQIVVEIISGDFWDTCIKNKWIHKLIRDVSWIHEYEEKRHILFAQIMLDEYFKESGFLWKTLWWWFVLWDVLFLNAHYIRLENFEKLWVKNYKHLYKVAKKTWKKNKYKSFNSKRWNAFIKRYWFITWGNRWAFKLFLGFDWK